MPVRLLPERELHVQPIDIQIHSGTMQAQIRRNDKKKDECQDMGNIRYHVMYLT
jgi:hypothetical protein